MGLFIQIITFVLIISILVILHELGHFIPAKLFKTKVEKFYLFFDPWFSLIKKKVGDTEYGIGWLPLGGYVKIAGMIDESMDKEQMDKPPQPWEFRSKPAWQRLIIMLGGVVVNFLLAWAIYVATLTYYGDNYISLDKLEYGIEVDERGELLGFKSGDKILTVDGKKAERYDDLMLNVILGDTVVVDRSGQKTVIPITDEGLKAVFTGLKNPFFFPKAGNRIGEILEGSKAEEIGLKEGDRILSLNGTEINRWENFQQLLKENRELNLEIQRGDQVLSKNVVLVADAPLGVQPSYDDFQVTDEYSLASAIPAGFAKTINVLSKQVRQFKVLFKPKTEAYKQIKGPIGIVDMMPTTWNWQFFWSFMAMFSVWLAFLNILPIPALDGGHVMFLLYEMIVGKAPSQKVMEVGQIIGFVIIMGLMVVIFGNDIWNLFK